MRSRARCFPFSGSTMPTRRDLLAAALSFPRGLDAAGLVIERIGSSDRLEWSPEHAAARHAPWATFRIPALLIAVETRALTPPARPFATEPRDELDAAWAWRDLRQALGADRLAALLRQLGYGNAAVPEDGPFEPDGPLMVSAVEQTRMLHQVLSGRSGLRAGAVAAYRTASRLGRYGEAMLHGIVADGSLLPGDLGLVRMVWLVGHIEQAGRPVAAFALHGLGRGGDTEAEAWTLLRDALRSARIA